MPTVGEILRSEREKKGFSIKDVEREISIRALYLNAIEEGNYSIIPGEVYLKGFIRNYANFLGLDVQQIMAVYRQSKEKPATVTSASVIEESRLKKQGATSAAEKSWNYSIAKWLIVALVAGGVAGYAWWSSNVKQPAPTPPPPTAQQINPTQNSPQPTTPSTSQPQVTTPAKPANAKPVVVTAKFSNDCWTLVTADGREIYEGIPKPGETLTWEADNKITMKLGNAGAVNLIYNGKQIGTPGTNGEVIDKTFTANSVTP
ncbi:MAG TPA: DUF4115 domain-containing protein [Methylomusa anaerophila]|uniref:Cytoskeletal protein RodZ n=1 Tax=Methylomusa anaerophila TaxID=1930071 RepID=A0A348APW6_9FIRM|nr:helix-turn-helix domain-containing protein [Methylomusa anaerophila]BBB93114.1 cytoskeletal protein RodZ [Methylomusa anaerophila]HML87053.1 DUF4115 domain-containing protein [Methylomusa anaerophila]